MSHTMPGNPFEKDAADYRNDATSRIADAILALAYEQHTANLIALEELEGDRSLKVSPYQAIIRQRMDVRGYERRVL